MRAPGSLQRKRSLAARRRRVRGAVMVEAALVLPVLVLFFGMMVFFHRAYKEKIRIRAEAREAAFSAASRGCPSGTASGSESSMSMGSGTGAFSSTAAAKGDGTGAALGFSHGTATAKKSATVTWNTGQGPLTKKLKDAESNVYCNENPIVTNTASWLDFGVKSFGGK